MSPDFLIYYFPHLFEFGVPILLFTLKMTKLDYKCIGSTMLISSIAYTGVHFINVWLNTNFMFSMAPNNPVLDLFRSIIPYNYWYMFLCLPIIFLYLVLLYHKQLISLLKEKRKSKSNV